MAGVFKQGNVARVLLDDIARLPDKIDTMSALNRTIDKKEFKCIFCDYASTSSFEIQVHQVEAHATNEDQQKLSQENNHENPPSSMMSLRSDSVEVNEDSEIVYTCDNCDYTTPHRYNLLVHREEHNLSDSPAKHSADEGNFDCTVCWKRFSRLATLRRHERIHTGIKPYKCPHCDYTALRKEQVEGHIQRRHSEIAASEGGNSGPILLEMERVTDTQEQHSDDQRDNEEHIGEGSESSINASVESNSKDASLTKQREGSSRDLPGLDVTGDVIDFSSAIKYEPIKYEPTDTGYDEPMETSDRKAVSYQPAVFPGQEEQEHEPAQSEDAFIDKELTKENGQKHKCFQCNFSTLSLSAMRKHRTSHQKMVYRCNKCKFRTPYLSSYKVHQAQHSGVDTPFKCNICSRGFAQRSTLRRHEHTHNGEKPYKCFFCSYSAIRRLQLKKHVEHHHREQCTEEVRDQLEKAPRRDRAQLAAMEGDMDDSLSPDNTMDQPDDEEDDEGPPTQVPLNVPMFPVGMSRSLTPPPIDLSSSDVRGSKPRNASSMKAASSLPRMPQLTPSPHFLSAMAESSTQPNGKPQSDISIEHYVSPRLLNRNAGLRLGRQNSDSNSSGKSEMRISSTIDSVDDRMIEQLVIRGNIFECTHCTIYFKEYAMFLLHKSQHCVDNPMRCNFCGRESLNKFDFTSHFVQYHQ